MSMLNKKTVLAGVVLVAGAAGFWKFFWKPAEENKGTMMTPTPSSAQPVTGMMENKDQAMMAEGQKNISLQTKYSNPGGGDEVGFVLTVDKNGVITKAVTEVLATNSISKMRQASFAAELPKVIVGKKLSDLSSIDRVGGSSLTTGAFNASLPQLKAQL